MRCRIAYEHVAEGSTVIDGNADADGITVRINHRCQMAGEFSQFDTAFSGILSGGRDGEHRQVGAEAVGVYPVPSRQFGRGAFTIVFAPQRSITFLICNSVCGMLQ